MKRFFGFMLSGIMVLSSFSVSAKEEKQIETKVYDECVQVSGYLPYAKSDDVISILVLNRDIDIESFDEYEKLEDIIVYHGETKVDKNSKYEFLFKTDSGGKHYVYVSADAYDDVITGEYSYISKTVIDNMPEDNLYEYMKANKDLLGLDEEIYTDDVIASMSEIILNSKDGDGFSEEALSENFEKSYVIAKINAGDIEDIKEYKEMLSLKNESDIIYFPEADTKEFTKNLKEKDFKNIKDFDETLTEQIIVFTINNSASGKIKSVISDNKEIFAGVTVSSGMAEYLKENSPYLDIEDIKDAISDYKPSGNTSSGGGGGNGGGGGKSNATLPTLTPGIVTQNAGEKQEFLPFDDILGVTWAKDAIVGLYHKGIINGKEARKFYPNDNVTRNEFAKIVTVAFNLNLIDDYFPFSDITEEHWAYPYVKTAYLAGITNGYSDTDFRGDNFITRQDLCVMVYRAFKACDVEIPKNTDKVLIDENEISDYAKDAVKALVGCGIISGDENSRFNPKNNATRAEAAKILYSAANMSE